MFCPYRKIITSYEKIASEETYAACQGEACPLYDPKLIKKCWRVQKEVNEAYVFGREDYYEHR